MRKHGRVDANQAALVARARSAGATWVSLTAIGGGCPDGLLGYDGRSYLVEFKADKGTLTPDQCAFIETWRGSPVHLVRSADDLDRLLHGGGS